MVTHNSVLLSGIKSLPQSKVFILHIIYYHTIGKCTWLFTEICVAGMCQLCLLLNLQWIAGMAQMVSQLSPMDTHLCPESNLWK